MTDSTRETLEAQVSAQLDSWRSALDHVADPGESHDVDDLEETPCEVCEEYGLDPDDLSPFSVLELEALSVEYVWRGANRSDAHIESVEIVLATGGPHVEIVARAGGRGLEIVGYWSSEIVRRPFHHPATEELAEELAELAEISG